MTPNITLMTSTYLSSGGIIETDLFLNVIIDAYAFMVWSFMMPFVKREIYSGYIESIKKRHCGDR